VLFRPECGSDLGALQPPGASCEPTFGVSGSGCRASVDPSGSFIGVDLPGAAGSARLGWGCSRSGMTELLGAKRACKTERVASSDPSIRRGNRREDYPETTIPVCLSHGGTPVQRAVSGRRTLLTRVRIQRPADSGKGRREGPCQLRVRSWRCWPDIGGNTPTLGWRFRRINDLRVSPG
jgi:hypothetical protein